jgi:hypothetical protein
VAWHAAGLALDFAADAIEDAVTLLSSDPPLAGFAIGIAEGELASAIDGGSRVVLSHGPALRTAGVLARAARAGEVLVDPACSAVRSGALMTSGSRLVEVGAKRMRAQLLDRQSPWRAAAAESTDTVRRLSSNPPRLGALDPGDLVLAPGTLAVVRADAGYGGTRLLLDLALAHGTAQLMVSAPPFGEPLGALRRAVWRARSLAEPALSPEHASLLESLLAGEGLDVVDSATLLGAWFSGAPTGGLALLDGAGEIDHDTLAALAQSCADGHLSIVARLGFSESLPAPLVELTLAGEVVVEGLNRDQALELAKQFCGGALYERAAARYIAARGATPLGVEQALCEGLESGALVWDPERALLRARGAARAAAPLEQTVLARLERLEPRAAEVITTLAVLGGEAELAELEAIVAACYGARDLAPILDELVAARWIQIEGEGELVALPSHLYRRAVLASLRPESLLELHRAIASVFEASTRPLAAASASLHALLGGRGGEAERLARRAASSAEASGLAATSEALEEFALTRAHDALAGRGLAGPWSWEEPPASRRFSALSELGPASEDALSGRAAHALREGDLTAIDEIVGTLRAEAANSALADRLEAMAGLARGETGAPLGLLRGAKERTKEAGAAERCRSALALGIALAAAGRETDALLEALEALARAREASDDRGERACSRFLAQLSRGAGDEAAAGLWDRAVIG